jgi:hypothetical protein
VARRADRRRGPGAGRCRLKADGNVCIGVGPAPLDTGTRT